MKKIGASKFREHCLALIDDLEPEGVVITRRGKPVARLVPYPRPTAYLIGSLRNKIHIHGDIMSAGLRWGDSDVEP